MDPISDTATTSAVLSLLAEIEAAADDVLIDRAQIVELDKKRQENRMAERYLKAKLPSENSCDKKTWMCLGNTFIKLPTKTAHAFLESNQKAIDKEIKTLRDGLKEKVNKLQELEGNTALNRGYYLIPLLTEDTSSGTAKDL